MPGGGIEALPGETVGYATEGGAAGCVAPLQAMSISRSSVLAATAAPIVTVALTTFVVNSRHVFYALSFPLDRVRGMLGKAYSTYMLSDEAYAVGVSPEAKTWTTRPIRAAWRDLAHPCTRSDPTTASGGSSG